MVSDVSAGALVPGLYHRPGRERGLWLNCATFHRMKPEPGHAQLGEPSHQANSLVMMGPRSRFLLRAVASLALLIPLGACAGAPPPPPPGAASVDVLPSGSSFKGEAVTFPSAAGTASGYLARPSGDVQGKRPALIVIQEWWGLNDWIKQNTDHFAEKGYVALAVDLYRGEVTSDPGAAHELMRGLPEDRAMADLKGAFEWLAARSDVDPARIGAIGWCMGGGYSLALAAAEPRLAAAVVNYGRLISDPASVAKISAPLLGNFAGKDRGIPTGDVQKFEETLKTAGKNPDIKIYPEQGHGFINPNAKASYDAQAAADAEQRIDAFFDRTLKKEK